MTASGRKGRVAVVSGAAAGLGRAYAQRLADDGFALALVDRDSCTGTIELLRSTRPTIDTVWFGCDVADWEAVRDASAAVHDRFGRVDVNSTPYTASKMGVIGLTRSLAVEESGTGITVNCIAPGMVNTPGTADAVDGGLTFH